MKQEQYMFIHWFYY